LKVLAIHLAEWLCSRSEIIRADFSGFGQGNVPETARLRQNRAEGP